MAARERLMFTAGAIALWGFFVAMALWTPTQLDDWYEVAWHRHHAFDLTGILEFARYNYANYNPRPGETFLLLVNGPRIVHVLITPAFEVALLIVVHVLARGRWPRADRTTLAELAVAQAVIWLVSPLPGAMYFYRPYTTNYLFASCVQLAMFIPFRLELERPDGRRPAQWWLTPLLLAWGVAAGMTNEHTGPAAIAIALGLVGYAHRRSRLRPWMVAAALGLVVGYLLLYFAPGQTRRYAGLATDISPIRTIREHGLFGCLRILGAVVYEVQNGLALVVGLGLLARRRARDAAGALDGPAVAVILVALAGAVMITVTTFASPITEDRVRFAACMLVAVGLVAATSVAWREPLARRLLVGAAAALLAFYVAGFAVVYRGLAADSADRIAALERAAPGEVVHVAPTRWPHRDIWGYGEDLQWAYMREFVAHRVYGVGGLELSPLPSGGQPSPPERSEVAVAYDPPIDARTARPDWPLWQFVPTQWPWVVREIRETLAQLDAVPGHRLRAIDVTVVPVTSGMPAGKPVYLVRWQGGKFLRIDARNKPDERGWFHFVMDQSDLPLEPTEGWVSACGQTRPVEIRRRGDELWVPTSLSCSGNHTVYLCDQTACWLAGRYW
jgi:hypothetical protein